MNCAKNVIMAMILAVSACYVLYKELDEKKLLTRTLLFLITGPNTLSSEPIKQLNYFQLGFATGLQISWLKHGQTQSIPFFCFICNT